MARIRLSTTVDSELLTEARTLGVGDTDSVLVDRALAALISRNRTAEIDAGYVAYETQPLDEPDEWGDLASFRRAAGAA